MKKTRNLFLALTTFLGLLSFGAKSINKLEKDVNAAEGAYAYKLVTDATKIDYNATYAFGVYKNGVDGGINGITYDWGVNVDALTLSGKISIMELPSPLNSGDTITINKEAFEFNFVSDGKGSYFLQMNDGNYLSFSKNNFKVADNDFPKTAAKFANSNAGINCTFTNPYGWEGYIGYSFTSNYDGSKNHFISCTVGGPNGLCLFEKIPHVHKLNYSFNNKTKTLTATCSENDCTYDKSQLVVSPKGLDTMELDSNGMYYVSYDGLAHEVTMDNISSLAGASVEWTSKPDNNFKNAGLYSFKVKYGEDQSFEVSYEIKKLLVNKPAEPTKKYSTDGTTNCVYDLTSTDDYTVTGTTSSKAQGSYPIKIALKDKTNKSWADGTTDDLTYNFVVTAIEVKKNPAVGDENAQVELVVDEAQLAGGVNVNDAFANLEENTDVVLTLNNESSASSIVFSSEAASQIADALASSDVVITFNMQETTEGLETSGNMKKVDEEELQLVLEISLGGIEFGNGKAEISVPFEKEVPEGKVANVYYVAPNGKMTNMNATLVDGVLTFNTNHFSTYVVVFEKPHSAAGLIVLLVVLFLIAAFVAVYVLWKKQILKVAFLDKFMPACDKYFFMPIANFFVNLFNKVFKKTPAAKAEAK